jgi:hypothetical protein
MHPHQATNNRDRVVEYGFGLEFGLSKTGLMMMMALGRY